MSSHDFSAYSPASKAEAARAAGMAPAAPPTPAPASVPAPAPTPVLAAPVAISEPGPAPAAPRFVGGRLRSRAFPLGSPIEFEGRIWDAIPLRRPTAKEVGEYFERLAELFAIDPEATLKFPIYFDEDGTRVPDAVLDFLDPDDREALGEAAEDFLPARLLRLLASQQPASPSPAGVNTAPISSTS